MLSEATSYLTSPRLPNRFRLWELELDALQQEQQSPQLER